MLVTIIDYGIGNLWSVKNAFEFLGANVLITSNPKEISSSNCIVLPGVGNFGTGMENLRSLNLINPLNEAVLEKDAKFLGICLGMQLLANSSDEAKGCEGLGWIPGTVNKFIVNNSRLPHIGFNEVFAENEASNFFNNEFGGALDFYFVHSYCFHPFESENILAWTTYGNKFVSAINKNKIFGVQFHPEKSQSAGLLFLSNFLKFESWGVC